MQNQTIIKCDRNKKTLFHHYSLHMILQSQLHRNFLKETYMVKHRDGQSWHTNGQVQLVVSF